MSTRLVMNPLYKWLAALGLALVFAGGISVAQAEPTINQVYDAARAGHIDQAHSMIREVIAAHPNSAKAHFIEAELFANEGRLDAARQALARAEQLAPGLPFANADAVRGLQSRLSGGGLNGLSGIAPRTSTSSNTVPASTPRAVPAPATPSDRSFGWLIPALIVFGGLALLLMVRRRSSAQASGPAMGGPGAPGFGTGGPGGYPAPGAPGSPYGQPSGQPYGQPYGQPAPQPGMGSRIAGGLATGAAIGAGMIAAEAIGRSITGHNAAHAQDTNAFSSGHGGGDAPIPAGDLGGNNFGISDTNWDDSSSMGSGDVGGGDWDN